MFAIDTLCEVTFGQGQAFGAVENGSDEGHTASMDRMWHWWSWIGYMPWLNWLDKKVSPWANYWTSVMPWRRNLPVFSHVLGKLAEYEKSLEQNKGEMRPCLLHDLKERAKEKEAFHTRWAASMAMTDLGAGVDTMSWTLMTVIVGIAQNPNVYARVRQELDDTGEFGRPGREPVTCEGTTKLPYLHACIEEAIRLWPVIAISLPRIVSRGGIVIDGHFIPEGFTVGMSSKVLGLDEKVFGGETEKFRPERWLEASKTQKEAMSGRNLGFGAANRKCPGQYLALFIIRKVLVTLLAEFNVKILNELDGVPGPGGHIWREEGTFATKVCAYPRVFEQLANESIVAWCRSRAYHEVEHGSKRFLIAAQSLCIELQQFSQRLEAFSLVSSIFESSPDCPLLSISPLFQHISATFTSQPISFDLSRPSRHFTARQHPEKCLTSSSFTVGCYSSSMIPIAGTSNSSRCLPRKTINCQL